MHALILFLLLPHFAFMFGLDVRWPHDCVSSCCCWWGVSGWGQRGDLWRGYSTWIWMGWLCVCEWVCLVVVAVAVSAVFAFSHFFSIPLSLALTASFPIHVHISNLIFSLCLFLEMLKCSNFLVYFCNFPTWLNYVANSRNSISRLNWQPAPLLIHTYVHAYCLLA